MRGHKKHLDFEINLIPCIDLLSVCICFLLLTAVWLQVASVNVKQAIGGQSAAETEKKPQLWISLLEDGQITASVKDAARLPRELGQLKLKVADLAAYVARLKAAAPDLKTVLIQPRAQSEYDEIIALMDEFKKAGMNDLGVVPL